MQTGNTAGAVPASPASTGERRYERGLPLLPHTLPLFHLHVHMWWRQSAEDFLPVTCAYRTYLTAGARVHTRCDAHTCSALPSVFYILYLSHVLFLMSHFLSLQPPPFPPTRLFGKCRLASSSPYNQISSKSQWVALLGSRRPVPQK